MLTLLCIIHSLFLKSEKILEESQKTNKTMLLQSLSLVYSKKSLWQKQYYRQTVTGTHPAQSKWTMRQKKRPHIHHVILELLGSYFNVILFPSLWQTMLQIQIRTTKSIEGLDDFITISKHDFMWTHAEQSSLNESTESSLMRTICRVWRPQSIQYVIKLGMTGKTNRSFLEVILWEYKFQTKKPLCRNTTVNYNSLRQRASKYVVRLNT